MEETSSTGTKNVGIATGGYGEIKNVGILDLTGMKSPEELARITSMKNVGAILVTESQKAGLAGIPITNTGATVVVPDGIRCSLQAGQSQMSGEALAEGPADEVLVVAGQCVITSPVTKLGYHQIIVLGQIIAPAGSEGALGQAKVMGQALYYPYSEGAQVRTHPGGHDLSPHLLANEGGQESDILLIVGDAIFTGQVERVGYSKVVIVGQLFAPPESQALLNRYIWSTGETVYYKAKPREFLGNERFSNEFFELLDEPVTLVITGNCTLEPDVARDTVRAKVAEIFLTGNLMAEKELIPLLQVLTTHKTGNIKIAGEGEENSQQGGSSSCC